MAWLTGYNYRQTVPLKRVDGAVTNYQMLLTVNKTTGPSSGAVVYLQNHVLSWTGIIPNDMRFTIANGTTELDYWIESSDANTAQVWIEFDSIGTTDTYFYIYYGKASDTTTSNGDNTFLFFDDFNDASIDSSKWGTPVGATAVEADGVLKLTHTQADPGWLPSAAAKTYADGVAETRCKVATSVNADYMMLNVRNILSATIRGQALNDYYIHDGSAYKVGPKAWEDLEAHTNDWHRIRVTFIGTALTLYVANETDGTSDSNTGTTTTTAAGIIRLECHGTSIVDHFDWVFVRKYVSPEPTWGSWGSEETAAVGRSFGFIIG